MNGVTKDESTVFVGHLVAGKEMNKKIFELLIKQFSNIFHYDIEKVNKFYLNGITDDNSDAMKQSFLNFYSDIMMRCPTNHFVNRYAKNTDNKNVYFFLVTHVKHGSPKPLGVYHTSELEFVFGLPLLKPKQHKKIDLQFTRQMVDHWTNFAKYG